MSETQPQNEVNQQKPTEEVNGQTDDDDLIKKWEFDDWKPLYKIAIKFFRGLLAIECNHHFNG